MTLQIRFSCHMYTLNGRVSSYILYILHVVVTKLSCITVGTAARKMSGYIELRLQQYPEMANTDVM